MQEKLQALVHQKQWPESVFHDLMVITDELLSNMLKYGGGDELQLKLNKKDGTIEALFVDNGEPFNPLTADSPDLESPVIERDIGGLGIELIKAMTQTQSYRYEQQKNILTLTLST